MKKKPNIFINQKNQENLLTNIEDILLQWSTISIICVGRYFWKWFLGSIPCFIHKANRLLDILLVVISEFYYLPKPPVFRFSRTKVRILNLFRNMNKSMNER